MATNKHAQIRYKALDRCFSNPGRKYFWKDLLEACNDAIIAYSPDSSGISRRQLLEDIKFMESEQGWAIELVRHKDGREVYYRYSDNSYSISNQPLNESEVSQLKEALFTLSRFRGMPQFGWVEEVTTKLESGLGITSGAVGVIQFEENPFLKGLSFITPLFHAIVNQDCVSITYQGFRQLEPSKQEFHPYLLKQYNNRWFLFGRTNGYDGLTNLALDRVTDISESKTAFVPNSDIDFEEYFEDVIGVSVDLDEPTQKLRLQISTEEWKYVESKPLHGSQTVVQRGEDGVEIELELRINHELIAQILSRGTGIKVLSPLAFQKQIAGIIDGMKKNYI